MSRKNNQSVFDNYIMATDGKLYRYNYERGNMFYCENNVVIKDYEAIQLDKARYEVFDNMILDKKRAVFRIFLFFLIRRLLFSYFYLT